MDLTQSNEIHHTAVLGRNCNLGSGNYIGPYCVLDNCIVGNNNRFEAFVSVGTPPEHKARHLDPNNAGVVIGNNNVFKEFVTINRGTTRVTEVMDDVWMLRGSHAGHDSILHNKANISCAALVGGHSIILEGANLGLSAIVRQNLVVGAYAMVGQNSTVTKNVVPFTLVYDDSYAGKKGTNVIGLERAGFKHDEIQKILDWQTVFPFRAEEYPMEQPVLKYMTDFKAAIDSLGRKT